MFLNAVAEINLLKFAKRQKRSLEKNPKKKIPQRWKERDRQRALV